MRKVLPVRFFVVGGLLVVLVSTSAALDVVNVAFSVFATSDLSIPFSNWLKLGSVPEIAPGQYQFSDPLQTTGSRY